jgi:hypothetical protein
VGHAQKPTTKPFGHPDVSLTVDAKTAAVEPDLEVLSLGRIRGREARDVVDACVY